MTDPEPLLNIAARCCAKDKIIPHPAHPTKEVVEKLYPEFTIKSNLENGHNLTITKMNRLYKVGSNKRGNDFYIKTLESLEFYLKWVLNLKPDRDPTLIAREFQIQIKTILIERGVPESKILKDLAGYLKLFDDIIL